MDRRVRKSKEAIKDAFTTLMNNGRLEEITVSRLCEEADINRSTFYLHYKNIDDLIRSIEANLARHITSTIDHFETDDLILNPEKITDSFTHIIQSLEADSDLVLTLINHSETSGIKIMIEQVIENLILDRIANMEGYAPEDHLCMPPSYVAVLFSSIFTSLLTEWLINGHKESPYALARFINEFAFQPIIQNMMNPQNNE